VFTIMLYSPVAKPLNLKDGASTQLIGVRAVATTVKNDEVEVSAITVNNPLWVSSLSTHVGGFVVSQQNVVVVVFEVLHSVGQSLIVCHTGIVWAGNNHMLLAVKL
jgi:hypothetical protein